MGRAPVRRDNRFSARLDVKVIANLREFGSKSRFEIHIDNLSLTGFGGTTGFRLDPGQIVMIALPTLAPIESKVMWVEGRRFGCSFDRALHVAVFDHIVARHRAAED